ncbi:CPBP family intramembrane metalloprotease [Actinoallomurus spadix]|uniref:Type II CAAX endopeptidase family protein n=1 Tax=Actinoallomurus spadix TaxID=79912 RepID=A0ABP3HN39_9ACTN|nr:type II CAAX endopeptidase family protein [Actinoallomurus spadix]MCO5990464.1 CPBP family intramembrane metalloprotease [Actinoallomurus spadix]
MRNRADSTAVQEGVEQRPEDKPQRGPRPAWVRLVVLLVLSVVADGVIGSIYAGVQSNAVALLIVGVLVGPLLAWLVLLGYATMVRVLERRDADEVGRPGAAAEVRRGTLLGIGLFSITIAVIAVFGGYGIHGWGNLAAAIGAFGMTCAVAVAEEVMFRGVLFRIVEEKTGTWGAMAVSAILFGALHLINSGATLYGAASIAIEGGLMLAAAYTVTRTLWLPIGLHLGWNFAEGGIFGTNVSGSSDHTLGLFKGTASGSSVLSGGSFGPEASIIALLVCGTTTVLLLRQARRRGRIRRRKASAAPTPA